MGGIINLKTMKIPYYEKIVNMYYQKEMDAELFFSLVRKDKKLRQWFHYHEMIRDVLLKKGTE